MSNRFTPEQLKAVADAAKKQKASQKQKTEGTRLSQQTRERLEQDVLDGFKKKIRADTLASDEKKLSETLSSLDQRQKSNAYVDPKEWEDAMSAAADISNRYRYYDRYLDRYGDEGGNKTAVQNALTQYSDMSRNLGSMRDFYGQFENKDAFQAYTDKKKREDYLINEYDLDAAKKEVDAAKAYAEQLAKKVPIAPRGMPSATQSATSKAKKEYDHAWKRYETLAEEYRQAENLKRLASYDALTKNSDFAAKSAAGDDALSRFLNMDEEARKNTDTWTKILGGITDGRGVLGSITDYFGLTHSDLNDMVDKYHSMTDDQRKVYNYLNNTKGSQAARDYLYDIGDDLSYRAAVQQQKELDSVLPDNWFGNTVGGALSFGNAFDSGVSGAISSLGEGIYQTFAQNDRVLNTSVSANRFGLDKEEAGKVQKVLLDLAQTTGNMIPSIVVSTATGVPILGAGMMGVQAKGAAYNQAIKDGYSPAQAQTYSTMVGALEGGLSYALTGIGKGATKMFPALGRAIDGISNGFLRGLASWGVEAAGEGLEEGLTEFFDPFLRYFVTGKYEGVNWKDVGYSAFLGALSGGFLEGTPAAMKAVSLPDATAEAFKTKYDTGNGYEGFSSRLFQDDTLLSAKVIELVKEDDAKGAIAALNKGLHNYRFAKEYARQHYGVTAASDIDKRIQTIETLKASIKAGKFNAQSADTALRKTSDIWQIAAENNDAVASALTSGELSNSKVEKVVLKDRGTVKSFERLTGMELQGTLAQRRNIVKASGEAFTLLRSSDAAKKVTSLLTANDTEASRSVREQNRRTAMDTLNAYYHEVETQKKKAADNGKTAEAEKLSALQTMINRGYWAIQNDYSLYFASQNGSTAVHGSVSEQAIRDQKATAADVAKEALVGLDAADIEFLTQEKNTSNISGVIEAVNGVKEKLDTMMTAAKGDDLAALKAQYNAVDRYGKDLITLFQNRTDVAKAEINEAVKSRIGTFRKAMARYGVSVAGAAGQHTYMADGKTVSRSEALRARREEGKKTTVRSYRGDYQKKIITLAEDLADGSYKVLTEDGVFEERLVTRKEAIDVLLLHEAFHYAVEQDRVEVGKSSLLDAVLRHVAGTRFDRHFELANRLDGKAVSKEAKSRWNDLKQLYEAKIKEDNPDMTDEAVRKIVTDEYLYEEIAADYMGALAHQSEESALTLLARENLPLFERIKQAVLRLWDSIRGKRPKQAAAAQDLIRRMEAIAKRYYGRQEKVLSETASENAAESPVGDASSEGGTNEGDAANANDVQEKAGEGAETVMENAEGEVEKRYSVGESSNFDSVYDEYLQARDRLREAKRLYDELTETEEHKAAIEKLHSANGLDELKKAVSVYQEYEESSGLADAFRKMKALEQQTNELRKRSEELQKQEAAKKEADAIKKSGLEPSEYRRKKAVKEFGYTPYFYDAGYLLPNGKLLNFSGEKGKHFGSRGQDHRAIGVIYENVESGSSAMLAFMGDGNIRVMAETPGIDIAYGVEPSKEQYEVISRFAQSAKKNGFFSIDITDEKGNTVANLTYEDSFSPVRIVNDIKHYFETGEVREQSTISQFRYSVSEEMDADYLTAVENGDMETAQKMVDEAAARSGYSRRMYHGSKNGGGFTVFRDWGYFTENRDYAQRYAQRENEKSLYEVYVKMDQPFDTRDPDIKEIFEENIRPEYGTSEIQDSGLPDWTDGYDIADYIDENDLDFDSIVLDEGGDMVNGQPVSRGLSYVVKHSAQVKSADPVTYDDNGNVIPLSERFNEKESDIRYSVAGVNSLDADFGEFDRALQMYQKGDSKNDIVRKTGWWLGKDGKWRYEISDRDMDFDRNGFAKNPKTVGDYVKHDKLFKAYPQLKDVRVAFVDKVGDSVTAKGRYAHQKTTIEIRRSLDADEAKKVMLHELQHAIQRIEGFKSGSSKKTGAMLAFNEVYDQLQDDPKFQRYSPDLKMKFIYVMTEQLMGAPLDVLARQNYQNDHGEIEAKMTVKRADMTEAELKDLPYFNDGIIVDNDKVQKKFVDNLIAMGYNEKKANQIAKEGLRYDYQYEDGREFDSERDFAHEGEGAGSRRSSLAADHDGKIGRQRQVYGAGEISDPDAVARKVGLRIERGRVNQEPSTRYSASGDVSMDEGAVGYEELKRQVAEQKEQIHRLTEEMVLSHGTHLDVKETGRFLKELLDRYGATLTVKDIEADVNDITEYLYRKYDVTRDEQGRFVSKEKVKEIDAAKLNDRIQRLATRIMESAVDVDSRFEEYTSFLKTLHNTPIGITEEIKQAYGDGWGAFRQRNFGRLNLRNAETSDLSAFYQEMADNYPEILDSSISDPVEQLKQLADAAKTIRETGLEPKNIYGLDGESVVADIAYDFSSGIASIDPSMNFADKAQQKVKDARLGERMHYGKKIAAIRERYEARLDEMAERFATKVKDRSEAQQARYQKKMVEKRSKDLAKRLAKPTKAKHIPEEFVPDVYHLLKQIEWIDKEKPTKYDREAYEQVASFLQTVEKRYPGEDALKIDEEGAGFSESLRSDIRDFNFKAIDSADSATLHKLNELLRRAAFEINSYDKTFHSGEKASVASLKAWDQFTLSREDLSEVRKRDKFLNWLSYTGTDPENFFSVLNVPILTEAYQNLASKQDKMARNVRTLTDDLKKIVGENGVPRDWRETPVEHTLSNGKKVRATPAQLMTLYLYAKQADSKACLLHPKGGVAFMSTDKKIRLTDKNGKTVETNGFKKLSLSNLKNVKKMEVGKRVIGGTTTLNDAMLTELIGSLENDNDTGLLTQEQRKMADALSRHLNTVTSNMANETSLETEGYRKYVIENYFPMMVHDRNKTFDFEEAVRQMQGQVATEGFSKERSGRAGKMLIADDIFAVINRHDAAVAQYNAFKKAVVDFKKILSIRPEGGRSLDTHLREYYGVGNNKDNLVVKYLNGFMMDVQGLHIATDEETLLSEKLLRNYKSAQVAANLSVVAKQPTAILRAMPEFTAKGVAAMKPVSPSQNKADIAEMQERSGLAAFKSWGYSEYATGKTFEDLYNANALTLRDRIDNLSSLGAEKMDELTWAAIWRAAKADTNSLEEATAKFNEVIRKTQVVNTAFSSSRVTRQGGLSKIVFAFKNEPLKTFNYIRSSINDVIAGKEGAKQKLLTVLGTSAVNTIAVSAISAAFSMLRDDDEDSIEEFFDKLGKNALDDVISNMTIIAGDVLLAIQAASDNKTIERMDLAPITDAADAVISVYEYFATPEAERKTTFKKVMYDLTRAFSNVTGIPVGNLARAANTLISSIYGLHNSPWMDYRLAAQMYNVNGIDNTQVKKKFRSILTDALNDGDYEGYARVKNELLSKGFSMSEIEKAIANSDVFYEAFNKGPEAFRAEVNAAQKYDPSISSTSVMSAIKSRKTGLVSDLYDAAKVGDKKAMQAVRDELLQLRDVDTKRLLTDKDIDRLLQEKYEKQLKSDVKERLVDLYGTEVYETIKRVILSEYRKFGVTSEEIDRIARSLR